MKSSRELDHKIQLSRPLRPGGRIGRTGRFGVRVGQRCRIKLELLGELMVNFDLNFVFLVVSSILWATSAIETSYPAPLVSVCSLLKVGSFAAGNSLKNTVWFSDTRNRARY